MGKKKPISQHDTVSASSNIFRTLFGDIEQNATGTSIFSDSNPFVRKPQENKLDESGENPKISEIEDPNVDDEKKRKRNKEKKLSADLDSMEEEVAAAETPLGTKKTKKVNTQNTILGSQSNEGNKDSSMVGIEPKAVEENNNKGRTKRKRDDLETDYEAKMYGKVPDEVANAIVVVGEKRKKADTEVGMVFSKEGEGFDDEDKLMRTVFVGNLPMKVKKKALIKEFSQFGEIESVRIRSVPILETKKPRKAAIMLKKINEEAAAADSLHAYIVFKTQESANASLAHNMAVVGGNHIRVDRACPPRKKLKGDVPLYDNKRTVFMGNLPFDVKDEEIYQLFTSIKDLQSSIEAVRVVRDAHVGLGKGIAYVLFKTREAANLAVKKRNLKVRDRELRLSHARQDSNPSKKRKSFSEETANSPAKKLAVDARSPSSGNRSNSKAVASYQGLRASKSGVQKKGHPKRNGPVKMKSKTQKVEMREGKRPAVAARKAKAKALKEIGASKQSGKKRKLDNRTPDSSNRKKKLKKFS